MGEISKEFSGEIQVEALFDLVSRRARELVGADYASVAITDDKSGDTIWVAGVGVRSGSLFTMRREPGRGFVGQAMSSGEPVIVEDFGENPAYLGEEHPFHMAEGMVAALVMPMSRGTRSLGALTVGFRRAHSFTDQEIAFLEALAGQAGIAMENAQLYSEETRRVAELEAVLDHMSEGVMVTDPLGRIVRFNEAARQLLGNLSPGSNLSEPEWREGLTIEGAEGNELAWEECPIARAARGEQLAGLEAVIRRGDSRPSYISVDGRPVLDSKGEVVLGVTVIHDVTPVREMDQLKDEFLSLAAHELKTPLTSIKGYAQMLLSSRNEGQIGESRRRALQVMDQQADRINRMVEQFLLVEEIRSGRLHIRPDRVDLAEIVGRCCRQIGFLSTGHRVDCSVCGEVVVHADPRGLDLVLTNLLENAVKFSSQGSSIEVSLALVGSEAVVCVKDRGVGIPKDRQTHVFDRFYQVKPGLQKGVGLGLYISQQLVAGHGGRMWFESENGQGSSFYFSLPLAEPQRQAVHA